MAVVEKRVAVSYASCSVPAAPIRREPSHRAEQTNEILFGERVEVLEHNPETDWAAIRCSWDGYEGWCKMGQLQAIELKEFWKEAVTVSANHNGQLTMDNGGSMQLPMGSELTLLKRGKVPVGPFSGKFKGKRLPLGVPNPNTSLLLDAARCYLHAPYHWGGRSLAGIDCSGLVQMAFKLCGHKVLRDAAQQATMGEEVHFLAESQPGDLAFFDNAEGRIVHVGILTAQDEIIHATDTAGRVVQDRIDGAGIISLTLKRRTHNLRMLRRVW
jgi:cell wall-associated NlpC family hydrolase